MLLLNILSCNTSLTSPKAKEQASIQQWTCLCWTRNRSRSSNNWPNRTFLVTNILIEILPLLKNNIVLSLQASLLLTQLKYHPLPQLQYISVFVWVNSRIFFDRFFKKQDWVAGINDRMLVQLGTHTLHDPDIYLLLTHAAAPYSSVHSQNNLALL